MRVCRFPAGMAWRGRPEAGELALPALALALALALAPRGAAPCRPGHRAPAWHRAVVGLEYVDPRTNRTVRRVSKDARFDGGSLCEPRRGLVGVPRAPGGDPGGCAPDTRFLAPEPGAPEPWVALVARGGCPVRDRVLAAARGNASALVVYGKDRRGDLAAVPADAGERGLAGAALRCPGTVGEQGVCTGRDSRLGWWSGGRRP